MQARSINKNNLAALIRVNAADLLTGGLRNIRNNRHLLANNGVEQG